MCAVFLLAVSTLIGPVDPTPAADATEYARLKGEAGRDADSQVKLALWCEAHGLEGERLKHLAIAVLSNPSHSLARGLLGLVEVQGKWKRPEAVAESLKNDVARADLVAQYNGKRVQTPVSVAPQYKLGLWCEENGLKDEARAHFATVVRLDPNHADAWKKLGYKRVGHRWLTDAQATAIKAEREAQEKADKYWRPRLEKLRNTLATKGKHEAAEKTLSEIVDPRAVPMVWQTFVTKGETHHLSAVQLLGQIDAIEASRGLANLALFAPNADVRRRATETLRRRDPREYADVLISYLQDKIKYEVKHVGGPGSPGELYIAGKKQNLKRVYAPPGTPNIALLPGDTLERDASGKPVLVHHYSETVARGWVKFAPANSPLISSPLERSVQQIRHVVPPNLNLSDTQILQVGALANSRNGAMNPAPDMTVVLGVRPGGTGEVTRLENYETRVPVGQIQAESIRVAFSAEQQLRSDVKQLEDENKQRTKWNERVGAVLKTATTMNLPFEPTPWNKWFVDQLGFKYAMTTPDVVPTVVESVPLVVQAQPIGVTNSFTGGVTTIVRHSCFGKGTLVQTIEGSRAIETIALGDQVLTQNGKTGKLSYQAVIMVHHNPPSATYRLTLHDKAIVTSYTHRFWKAGHGWVMARDLAVGDVVRTLGGVAKVSAIEQDKVQPVFNLDVEGDNDFFAGEIAALVHDNTLPDLKQVPFDAPPTLPTAKP